MFECLKNYWEIIGSEIEKNCNKDKFIQKEDTNIINNDCSLEKDYTLHLNLFPEPFNGNLRSPKIVFLFLNPGYNEADEDVKGDITDDVIKAFKQNYIDDDEYPFFWLNSKKYTNKENANRADIKKNGNPGAYYWNKLFDQKTGKSFMKTLAKEKFNKNDDEARKWVAKNVCDIELFPYHSKKFHHSFVKCNSAHVARCNVFKEIKEHPEVLFVFMRSVKLWTNGCKEWEDLLKEKNVIINPCPRNPSLNPDKELGGAILKWLRRELNTEVLVAIL